ncbi:hypothetical protein H5410_053161 [Solanum commersonii]|uniref:DUF7746 domain-containing protein n=1 Tax=Solanum commersonii TaxID=4109 RepID=A0A9J5X5M9_SOLCO|nr:hypothetical protein H5410_053161 [Solanum commersonii]
MVHRMLMYATNCKSVSNTDKTICKMIIAGFIDQLRGWWDNYRLFRREYIMNFRQGVKLTMTLFRLNCLSSIRSETSEVMQEAQSYEEESLVDALKKAEDFLAKLKDKVLSLGASVAAALYSNTVSPTINTYYWTQIGAQYPVQRCFLFL